MSVVHVETAEDSPHLDNVGPVIVTFRANQRVSEDEDGGGGGAFPH